MTSDLLRRAAVSGTFGSLASTAALMLAAEAEGKAAWRPTNATAHWRYGPIAAAVPYADLAHTGLGYATHHAATTFWALGTEWWAGSRERLTPAGAIGGALVVSAIAAAVDYGVTPKLHARLGIRAEQARDGGCLPRYGCGVGGGGVDHEPEAMRRAVIHPAPGSPPALHGSPRRFSSR